MFTQYINPVKERLNRFMAPEPVLGMTPSQIIESPLTGYKIQTYEGEILREDDRVKVGKKMLETLGKEFKDYSPRNKFGLLGYQFYNLFHPDPEVQTLTSWDVVTDKLGEVLGIFMVYYGSKYARVHCYADRMVNLNYLMTISDSIKRAGGALASVLSMNQFNIAYLRSFFGRELDMRLHKDRQFNVDHVVDVRAIIDKQSFDKAELVLPCIRKRVGRKLSSIEPQGLDEKYGSKIEDLLRKSSPFQSFHKKFMSQGKYIGFLDKHDTPVAVVGYKNPVETPYGEVSIISELATDLRYRKAGLAKHLRSENLIHLFKDHPEAIAVADVAVPNVQQPPHQLEAMMACGYEIIHRTLWTVAAEDPTNFVSPTRRKFRI